MATITRDDCVQPLKSKLGHDDFSLDSFSLEIKPERLGFTSSQADLKVVARIRRHTEETLTFFVKIFEGASQKFEKYLTTQKYINKEFDVVSRMIPDLEDVAEKKISPKFFHGVSNRFMIFEHLSEAGFELCRRAEMDLIHACLGIETLAQFHALSFIKEREWNHCPGDKYREMLYETVAVFPVADPQACFMYGADKRLRCFMRECLEDFNDVDGYSDRLTEKFTQIVKPSTRFKNVICHGDCWANNILYKYDESDSPRDAILVDFQLVRFVPPAHDLVYFMWLNVTPGLRQSHKIQLLRHYYDSLGKVLSERGINVQDVLSDTELNESFDYYSNEYGLLIDVYYVMPAVPMEYWPDLFGDDESMYETMAKGNVSSIHKILNSSSKFKEEMKVRLLNVLEFHKEL